MILLFANNAGSTLASGLPASGAGSTSIVLAAGTGALFPSPGAGEAFKVTLTDAATRTLNEICLCTARSTDTLTVLRAQEGTTALGWAVGDLCNNYGTAGAAETFVQEDQIQVGTYDISSVGGTGNAWTGTLTSNLTALVNGLRVRVPALNTTLGSFNLTLGATATGAVLVYMADPGAVGGYAGVPSGSYIPAANYLCELTYNSSIPGWILSPISPPALSARAMVLFAGGTLATSIGIATWVRASAGVYNFTFNNNLPSANWGITWGADSTVATASVSASNKLNSGGTINGFDTNTGAAKDVDGTVIFWQT